MKAGTKIKGVLIVDERFTKNMSLQTAISAQRDSLKTALSGEGLEIYSLSDERLLKFPDESDQIRQDFTLIATKKLTKDQIYTVVNMVRPQPLKFS